MSQTAVCYYRTSSATNVDSGNGDKDSLVRQQDACRAYAKHHGLEIVQEYYDAAVSGADQISERPGFSALLERVQGNGCKIILVESASRFARDLMVQLTGHSLLKDKGIDLVPVDSPTFFVDPSPTARMVSQILGSVSEFERASLVAKLKRARDRKRALTGRCEGPPPPPEVAVKAARLLADQSLGYGRLPSYRAIAAGLASEGHLGRSGKAYGAASVRLMLTDAQREARKKVPRARPVRVKVRWTSKDGWPPPPELLEHFKY